MTDDQKTEACELAQALAQMIDARQGENTVILDVSGPLGIADYFVISTAKNLRHAHSLGRELDTTMKHKGLLRRNLAGLEGESGWVLLDFNTVVVHVFSGEARDFYGLENLWADVPRVPFTRAERREQTEEDWLPDPEESYPDSIGNP